MNKVSNYDSLQSVVFLLLLILVLLTLSFVHRKLNAHDLETDRSSAQASASAPNLAL